MQQAVAAFLRHLDLERNASPHTVRAYGEDLEQFRVFLERTLGRAARAAEVDHLLIRGFLAHLHGRGLKKVSAARKLASLRTFFRFLCREGVLDQNPARALLSPRLERRIPSHLDEGEVAALLDVPGDGDAALRAPSARAGRSGWSSSDAGRRPPFGRIYRHGKGHTPVRMRCS